VSAKHFFRANIVELEGYTPGFQPGEGRVIKLNTNENPYPPSARVLEALKRALDDRLRFYPQPTADSVRRKAAEVYGFRPEEVLVGNGSDELLGMVFRAFVGERDEVAWPCPTYTLFDVLAGVQAARARRVDYNDDYSMPEALFSNNCRLTLVANPNSPSGTVVPQEQLSRLAESLEGALVIDEAYVDFAEQDCLPLVHEHDNTIVLRTLSKSFSLAGMRIGLAFAQQHIIAQLLKVKDSYNVNRLSALAAEAALSDLPYMRANVERIRKTRVRLIASLQELALHVYPSQANFVLVRFVRPPAAAVYEELQRRGILVRYFQQRGLEDCLRITVGSDTEMDALLKELRDILGTEQA
jgi:histidinol-phosphate aminotransferase